MKLNQIIEENIPVIIDICRTHDVNKMWVFGSVCTEKFSEKSDVDLLVTFQKNISVERYTDNYFNLHEKFETLFKRPIDLLTDKMLSNPYFIKVMEKTKTLIYER